MVTSGFKPQLAVVTGAGSGIGRGTAKALASRGAVLVIADIDLVSAQDAAREIRDGGGHAFPYRLDVADTLALEEFATDVKNTHGVPDVVVNNAGILVGGPLVDVPLADLKRIIDINLLAMVHGCRVFGGQMVDRDTGGHLVNIASMAAFAAAPFTGPYSISKYAVNHFSECIRAELAPYGIGVTAVCPGLIATNLATTMKADGLLDVNQSDLARRLLLKGQAMFGMHPDKAGRIIVRAIEKNRAIQPVRIEAHLSYPLARYLPGVVRALMTQLGKRDIKAIRDRVAGPQTISRTVRLVEHVPFRENCGVNSADGTLNTTVEGAR
ncbi:SDR family NAD(P)-dependent oxidoreductase [Mycobacteroides chelonae]|uniref:SDR family NAD(P)-dependent oxidoreductase n=1 Tax=Mycobacteroides chelonae TaxID=1774 RepID=UPI0008A8695D|nr:SDR family NAD(P)-dependent oxidoreductase [Mycobacteroides chelonae]OHU53274.1 hypothetical protein BKG81_05480 [Mycobacteroides chelonae]